MDHCGSGKVNKFEPAVQWTSLVQLVPLLQEEVGRLCLQQLMHNL